MQIIRGILLLSLLTLFGIIVWGRRPQVSANLQSPLPTVVADTIADEPCLTATDADFAFDFYGFVHGRDNTTTLTYSVTNLNQKDISYVAFGTAQWTRLEPSDRVTATLALGTYHVEWTNDRGNPGFTSVKYETQFGGFSRGTTDTFTLIVSDFDSATTIQVEAKAGQDRGQVSFALDAHVCDKTLPTPTPTETATLVPTATQPQSPLPTPTLTPWSPPPPPVATPTAIPLAVPQDNSGSLYYGELTKPRDVRINVVDTDAVGNPIGEPEQSSFHTLMPATDLFTSADGRYLIVSTDTMAQVLQIFDRQSGELVSTLTPQLFFDWHPDNQHIAVRQSSESTFGRGIWQINVVTGQRTPLALQQGRSPSWLVIGAAFSPNGQQLAYSTGSGLWIANANGSNPKKYLDANVIWDWSFDSRYFVYTGGEYRSLPKGDVTTPRYILWVFDTVTGERWPIQEPYPLPFGYGFSPILSPATSQLAYIGMVEPDDCFFNDSAYFADPLCQYRGFSLYAADLETGNVTWIADNVGKHTWSPDGSAIAYTQLDEQDQVDLWITHLQDGQTIQLTDSLARETAVIWIPER